MLGKTTTCSVWFLSSSIDVVLIVHFASPDNASKEKEYLICRKVNGFLDLEDTAQRSDSKGHCVCVSVHNWEKFEDYLRFLNNAGNLKKVCHFWARKWLIMTLALKIVKLIPNLIKSYKIF